MKNKKLSSKVLKYAIIPMFIFGFIFLVGCNANATVNTLNTISLNMDKIIKDINNIETIDTSTLIIEDFMDEDKLVLIDNIDTSYQSISTLESYMIKLSLLNNTIYETIEINDIVNDARREIIAKAHQVKSLSEQYNEEKNCLDNQNLDTLEELNTIIMSNNTRASLTRNEVKNNLANICNIKNSYNKKTEQLSSRYEKLQGSLSTRLSYYNNILNSLNSITYIISSNCGLDYCPQEQDIKQTTAPAENNKESKLNKNIDSYENAGRDFFTMFKSNNPYYNNDGYLNGYNNYYNRFPNFGNMYGNGFGGFGGYGIPMPYGYGGYGYTYPNINTYWTYKNIDTYKPRPIPKPFTPEIEGDVTFNDTPKTLEEDEELLETFNQNTNINQSGDNAINKENVEPRQPKPMPRPFIPNKELPRVYRDDNTKLPNVNNNDNLIPTPMESCLSDTSDGEDKFVNDTDKKPLIEKLDK